MDFATDEFKDGPLRNARNRDVARNASNCGNCPGLIIPKLPPAGCNTRPTSGCLSGFLLLSLRARHHVWHDALFDALECARITAGVKHIVLAEVNDPPTGLAKL